MLAYEPLRLMKAAAIGPPAGHPEAEGETD